jgi:8-oxo-dGTP diphosphatase
MNQPRVGVATFIRRDGKFLMGQRRNSHGHGTWSIPGGHLEFGETPQQTAVRETLEETGMHIKNVRFGAVTNDIFQAEGKHYITFWMIADWESGEPEILEPDKFVEQKWADLDTLPEPLFSPCWENLFASEFFDDLKLQLNNRKQDEANEQ